MDIYVVGESNGLRRGVCKFIYSAPRQQIVISPCLRRNAASGDDISAKNFHTTRHRDKIHKRIYVNGKGKWRYYIFDRAPLDKMKEYEIIQCIEVSNHILVRETYKAYPSKKNHEFTISNFDVPVALYAFIGPPNRIKFLAEDLIRYKEISMNTFSLGNFVLLIACQRAIFAMTGIVVCKLGMHIKTHETKGIGNFTPYASF